MRSKASCHAFGFFLVQSRLAADFLMLVFAIHITLVLTRPDYQNPALNGLYPYRKIVYLLWVLLPSILAVIPLTKDKGFSPTIYGCDVSTRDLSLAVVSLLAWRGIIFFLTMICYVLTSIIVLRSYFKVSKSLRTSYELLGYADPTAAGMRERIMQTAASLGFMFVYPSVYLALWSPPFVVRLLHRINFFHAHHNSYFYMIMVICMCSHTFFDVLLYLLFRTHWSMDGQENPPNYILLFRASRELVHGRWKSAKFILRASPDKFMRSASQLEATLSSGCTIQNGPTEDESEVIDLEEFLRGSRP